MLEGHQPWLSNYLRINIFLAKLLSRNRLFGRRVDPCRCHIRKVQSVRSIYGNIEVLSESVELPSLLLRFRRLLVDLCQFLQLSLAHRNGLLRLERINA